MFGQMFSNPLDQEAIRQLRNDQKRIERKLDLLLKHAGVVYDPYEALTGAVADALRAGRKIEAIKLYRAETGAGLREAKEFVDAIPD